MPSPCPIPIIAVTPASTSAVLWRMQGAERITVIVKATFTLHHERPAELTTPLEIIQADKLRDGAGSLEEASEMAPYIPGAGVYVRGHACAPAGQTATALKVRLALFRDNRWILNKELHVFGDRTREAPAPRPFQQMPLHYERAYGGPHVEANPVGIGGGSALPNIVDPSDPLKPASLGPVARHWSPRKYFLAWNQEPELPVPVVDGGFDFRYYQAAPQDQQVDLLRGDEWIFLEGMHPKMPWMRSNLPAARGLAQLQRAGARGEDQPIELVADTLSIDADRLICSVLWRGSFALQLGDTAGQMRVLAGVEVAGRPVEWPAPESIRPPASSVRPPPMREGAAPSRLPSVPSEPRAPARTINIEDESTTEIHLAALAKRTKQIAPFAIAEPGKAQAPEAKREIPGAPWSNEPAERPKPPLERTAPETRSPFAPPVSKPPKPDMGPRSSLETTAATTISPFAAGAASRGKVLPFVSSPAKAPPPARPEAASAGVPFALPFANVDPATVTAAPVTAPAAVPPASPPSMMPAAVPSASPPPMAPAAVPPASLPPLPPAAVPLPPAIVRPPSVIAKPVDEPEPPTPRPASAPAVVPPIATPPLASAPPPLPAAVPPALAPAPDSVSAPTSASAPASVSAPAPAPAPASASASSPAPAPPEPEAKGLRATVLARIRNGESLHDLDLAAAELDGIDFTGAVLSHRSLAGSNLTGCTFARANLAGSDLSSADLTGAVLDDADLSGASLSRSTLDRARFSGASLQKADLSSAKGAGTSFEGASLDEADLRQARLSEAVFDRASLAGITANKADLSRSSLERANLRGATLRAAKLKEARLPLANVEGADLRDADLAGANVYGVTLSSARTNGAILRDVVEIAPENSSEGASKDS